MSFSCGSGRDEEPSGEKDLRLIQIRLAGRVWKKSARLVKVKTKKGLALDTDPSTRIPDNRVFGAPSLL
jgi:hypothetical protein